MKTRSVTEKINKKWKGTITFQGYRILSKKAKEIDEFLKNAIDIPEKIYKEKLAELIKYSTPTKKQVFYNQIVLSGRSVFAMRLNNETTYTGAINWGAVGTSATAVSDSDTTLVAEAKRKGIATRSRTGDSVSLRFYYSKSDVSGTLREFGTFIDGTATVDTGQLFNRVLTGGWVKSASEALTVTVQFDLNPS